MDKKIIDNIVWWIPFKKLRNLLRCYLYKIDDIDNKLDMCNNMLSTISEYSFYTHPYSLEFNSLEFNKRFFYESKKKHKSSILILALFGNTGGVEERLYKILKFYKEKYNVFILSDITNFNFHKIIEDKDLFIYLTNIYLNNTVFNNFLRNIIIYHNISILEIHYTSIFNLNLDSLKLVKLKLVAHFHSSLDIYGEKLNLIEINKFDMVVKVKNDINICHNNIYILRNGVEKIENIYKGINSKKCIIISRLDSDKINSIINFIEFAIDNNLAIDIAGTGTSLDYIKNYISDKFKTKIKDINFLGYIDTVEYLSNNPSKYFFVSGLGQVVLEAISLGFPCLMSDRKEHILTFITRDNWLELYHLNFSNLNHINEISKKTNLEEVKKNIQFYTITDIIEDCLIDRIIKKYIKKLKYI